MKKAGGRPAFASGRNQTLKEPRRRLDVQAPKVFEAIQTNEADTRDGHGHPLTLACRAGCAAALGMVRSLYSRVSCPGRRRELQNVCSGGRQRPRSRDGTCGRGGVLLHSWLCVYNGVPVSCGQRRNLVRTMPHPITFVPCADIAATLKFLVRTTPQPITFFQPHA